MIEVIVFGKGYGESILLHIKEKWIVVDSFIEPKTHIPVALKYLFDNGYDIEDIVGIICTHWDNDHTAGISQIIEQHSEGLTVCLPIVYNDERFIEYIQFNSDETINTTSEFLKVLKLVGKKKVNRFYTMYNRELFQQELNDPEICLKALSPNDRQFTAFLESISTPKKGQIKRKSSLEENRLSVVTYIKTCIDTILLGGDMENSPDGWGSICNCYRENKCHVFKIPHHGSKNAHNLNVWTKLVDRPISIITRFNASHLPTDKMVETIAKESSVVYVVGPAPARDRDTIKRVRKFGDPGAFMSVTKLDYDYGYIKLSKSHKDMDWTVDTFGAVEKHVPQT